MITIACSNIRLLLPLSFRHCKEKGQGRIFRKSGRGEEGLRCGDKKPPNTREISKKKNLKKKTWYGLPVAVGSSGSRFGGA